MKVMFLIALFFLSNSVKSFSQTTTRDEIPPPPPPVDTALLAKKIYDNVEVEAGFPGGDKAWNNFLAKNLNASVAMDHDAPLGKYTVWVQFIVDKEGHVTDIKPLTNWGYGMEEEVVRILKLVPDKWIPAMQNGRPVKAYRKQPVTFVMSEEGFDVTVDSGKDVFYVGTDNAITVKVDKVREKNLAVTTSQGTIEGSNGHYTVRANKPGRAVITVYNKDKEIGEYSFEVKALPDGARNDERKNVKNDEENNVWAKVETEASFPGGDKAWQQFLVQNLDASVPVKNKAPNGKYTVWVQFIVDKEGNVGDFKALTNNGYGMEEEVLRILKKTPKWVPAMQNGRYVKAYRRQPVTFVVRGD